MSFKNIGTVLSNVQKGSVGLTDTLKGLGSLEEAANALKYVDQFTDKDKIGLLKGAFKGVDDDAARAALGINNLGNSMANTAKQSGGLGSALKGMFAADPFGAIVTGATAAIGIISMIKSAVDAYKQALIDQANEATSSWNETKSSLSEYASEYKELRAQLDSGELSEAETISVKQQILDIQNQIVDQYGEQASGIDLINGKLESQLGIIQGISQEEASRNINDNLSAYEDAEKEMLEKRNYYLGNTGGLVEAGGISKEIYDLAKETGIELKNNSQFDGEYNMYLDVDAEEAEGKLDEFQSGLRELKKEYEDQDLDVPYALQDVIDQTAKSIEENNEVLTKYRENYESYLEQQLFESEDSDILMNYVDAIEKYNNALSEGDQSKIDEARAAFEEADAAKEKFLSTGSNDKFTRLFDDATDQLDDAAIKFQDLKDILDDGIASDGNQFSKALGFIKRDLEEISNMDIDAIDLEAMLKTDGLSEGEEYIRSLARLTDFDLSTDEGIQEFIDALVELGIVSVDTGASVSEAASDFDAFKDSMSGAIEQARNLSTILSDSTSGSGLSGDNLQAFRDMFGSDAEKALEKTANGYHINKEALSELQQKQSELVKSNYLGALNDQYDQLRQATIELSEAQIMGEDTTPFVDQIEGIQANIQNLQDLQLEYEATTSAYKQWQSAMSDGSERDMYENIQGGYSQITDLIERGWGGSDEVRTYVDLLSSEDLSNAGYEEVMAAYEKLGQEIGNSGYSILDFFMVDEDGNSTTDGIYNFFDTVNSVLGDEFAKINENGDYEFDFLDGGDQKVADALGTDVEAVQSILRAAIDAGFVVNLDQPIQSMEELKASAEEAKTALSEMGDTQLSDINLDASSYDELTNSISAVQSYIEEVNNSDLDLNVKEDKLEEANTFLNYLVQRKSELTGSGIDISVNTEELQTQIAAAESALEQFRNEDGTFNVSAEGYDEALNNLTTLYSVQQQIENDSVVMSIDTSQLDGDTQNALSTIQSLQQAIADLNVQNQLKSVGVDVDTTSAETKVYELTTQLQSLDGDTMVSLGLDTEGFQQSLASIQNTVEVGASVSPDALATVQSAINGINAEALVKFGVNRELVDAYLAQNKDDAATVKYSVDATAVNSFLAQNHDTTATLKYTISVSGTLPGNLERTVTYKTVGGQQVNGTAHAFGTVQDMKIGYYRSRGFNAHAMGDWSLPAPETALVNELGTEGLIRDGKFSLIPGGAHLHNFKRGDIIFNHKQVQELLANGFVTSGGGHGKLVRVNGSAYNLLNAYSSGSGPNRRPSRPSYNMAEDYINHSPTYSEPDPEPVYETADAYDEVSYSASSAAESVSDAAEAVEEFNEKIDWIEVLINRVERAIDKLSKTAGNTYELFTTRNNALSQQIQKTTEEINYQQQAYNRYIQEANSVGLSEDWAAKVRDGVIDIQEITDENLKEMIDDYSEWYEKALDCSDAIDDLKISVQELYEERFNNVVTEYDGMIGQLQDRSDLLDAYIDQTETKGYLLSSNYYTELIKTENDILKNLQSQRTAMNNALTEAVSAGQIKQFSESWYDMQSQIDEVTQSIVESQTAIVEYNNAIRQLQWDAFDMIQDRISDINDEAEFLMDLLDADDLFDEHGKTKDTGAATFGLLGVRYNTYMQQADMYREEMEKLDAEIAKDPANQTLLERRQELLEAQRESISAAEDEKDAIKDLVEDGINAQLDALQDLIDRYKDMMDQQRQAYEYQQNMMEQSQEIANLEKQLSAYAGDDSEEGRLKRQEIENQLSDARQNLQDTQYDQQISETEKLLDDLYDQYETILNMRLDNIDQLVSDVVNNINLEASSIRDTIVSEADSVGYDLTDTMNAIWSESGDIGTILSNYSGKFTTTMTTLQAAIDQIKNYVADLAGVSDKEADTNISSVNSSSTTKPSTPTPQPSQPQEPQNNSGDFFIHKKDTYWKDRLQTEISIVDRFLVYVKLPRLREHP